MDGIADMGGTESWGPVRPPRRDEPWSYYQHWLGALEAVLADTVRPEETTTRARSLAQRPTGHDHRH